MRESHLVLQTSAWAKGTVGKATFRLKDIDKEDFTSIEAKLWRWLIVLCAVHLQPMSYKILQTNYHNFNDHDDLSENKEYGELKSSDHINHFRLHLH